MKKRLKRGITIVEAVVAMAVISIVTLAAIGTINQVAEGSANYRFYEQARIIASNALECYKYADDLEKFEEIFKPYSENGVKSKTDNSQLKYEYSENKYTMTITVDNTGGFEAVAYNSHGNELFNISYSKG